MRCNSSISDGHLFIDAEYGDSSLSLLKKVLICIPSFSLSATDYYVKTDGVGKGTSWEDAMSGDAFSATLLNAEDGATFHFAEGIYQPILDMNGKN